MSNSTTTEHEERRLRDDVAELKYDASETLQSARHVAQDIGDKLHQASDKVSAGVHAASEKLHNVSEKVHGFSEKARNTSLHDVHESAGQYISSRPLASVLVAIAAGAVVGMLFTPRR